MNRDAAVAKESARYVILASLIFLLVPWVSGPVCASGYLWLSGYDWSGNPTPIYRYDIAADSIDLVVDTGLDDQMVNNLAIDGVTLYIGGGHGQEFWKAEALTGEVYDQKVYSSALPTPLLDGAFRASNGDLYRAQAFARVCETDTTGQLIAVHDVTNGGELNGLEFIEDQLYATNAGFGSIETGSTWTFTAIPLTGIGSGTGWFYGGLAYDAEAGVLYMGVIYSGSARLYRVDPGAGTAELASDLPIDAGYPLGAWPQAMGWVSGDPPTGTDRGSWGHVKKLLK